MSDERCAERSEITGERCEQYAGHAASHAVRGSDYSILTWGEVTTTSGPLSPFEFIDPPQPTTTDYGHIKIVSDGTAMRSRVLVDGKPTANVQSVVWQIDAGSQVFATATVTYSMAEVEIVGALDSEPPKVSILATEVDAVAEFLRAHRDAQDKANA